MSERHSPFLEKRAQWSTTVVEQLRIITGFDQEPVGRRQLEARRAQLREPGDCLVARCGDLRMPGSIEIFDPEQPDPRQQQFLLSSQQRRERDIAWVQLNLDDRISQRLEFYKAEILYRKPDRIVIRVGITEGGQKPGAAAEHPFSVRGHEPCRALHDIPATCNRRRRLDIHHANILGTLR
ncbi:MAG: hypothetical protein ACREFH_01065 [Stellaceae bacterium]